MANSGTVTAGSAALASQYNNLRADVLNVSTGHTHTGASENGAKVAATGVSSGTAALGAVLTADGSGAAAFLAAGASGGILKYEEFTSSGSFVIPANASSSAAIVLEMIGAGGGGASGFKNTSSATAGIGGVGGAGGMGGNFISLASVYGTAGGTVTVTIGAGGAGGTGATGAGSAVFGSDGGATSFGSQTLFGGLGGPDVLNTYGVQQLQPLAAAFEGFFPIASSVTETTAAGSSILRPLRDNLSIIYAQPFAGGHPGMGLASGTINRRNGFDSGLGGGGGASGGGCVSSVSYPGGIGGARVGRLKGEFAANDLFKHGNGVAGGTASGGAGANATSGGGGGGGGGAISSIGGAGGAGAQPGGGGGGGGACSGAGTSGAGGAGGNGRVRVWVVG